VRPAKLAAWKELLKVILQYWREVGPCTTLWTADRDEHARELATQQCLEPDAEVQSLCSLQCTLTPAARAARSAYSRLAARRAIRSGTRYAKWGLSLADTQTGRYGRLYSRRWLCARRSSRRTARNPPSTLSSFSLLRRASHKTQCVMSRLIHTGLGSSSLIAHVLHYPPPPTRTAL
jgi:hypothetical protein